MTPTEANKIDINTETNLDKLRELVRYWQNKAATAEFTIRELNQRLGGQQNENDEHAG